MPDHWKLFLYGAGAVVGAKIVNSILVNWLNLNLSM